MTQHSSPVTAGCDWPDEPFTFHNDAGEHDPCYVVMPGGAMLSLNHHAGEGVDIARAKFIVAACNAALSLRRSAQRPIRQTIEHAIREHFKSIGTSAVVSSDGIERVYYSGFSLIKLAEAIVSAVTSTDGCGT